MAFDLTIWKERLAARLPGWKARLGEAGVNSIYAFLSAAALWPVVEAYQRGDIAALMTLGGILSGIGNNLLANQIQSWKDETDAARQLARTLPGDPTLRAELDAVLEKLDMLTAAEQALSDADKVWFVETIREELQRLGSTISYSVMLVGNGVVAQKNSTAIGARGIGIDGNAEQSLINTGVIYTVYQSAPGKPRLDEEHFNRMLDDYLAWVQKAYGKARLYGLESLQTVGEKPKRRLADVFVPLALQRFTPPKRAEIEKMAQELGADPLARQKAFLKLVETQRQDGEKIALEKLLTLHDRLAVIGGAGSGKSTLLAYLAASLASHLRHGHDLPFGLPGWRKVLFPIIVPLRYRREYLRLVGQVPEQTLTRAHPGTLAGFILWYLMKRSQAVRVADEALAEDFFDRLLRGGGCLVMLDGLDEVVSGESRGQVREEVEKLADEIYPGNQFIVTARESGYRENAIFSDDFLRLDVLPLEDEQIHALVENWCQQLYPEQVESQTAEITAAIRSINARYERQKLPPLVRTPLMTTMVVSVKWGEAELPRERARLYEAVIKVILQAQYLDDDPTRRELVNWGGPWEEQRDWLSTLALEMHRGGQASVAIDETRLREILSQHLLPENLEQFIVAVRSRGGVLEEKAGLFQFAHLTFQEFLAARLLAKDRDKSLPNLVAHVADPWWRETLLLVYGFAKMDYAPFAETYLNWLSHELPFELRLAGRELAAAAVLEIERPDPLLRERQGELLANALENPALDAQPKMRALAGDTLAILGDPRFDPRRWHLPADPTLGFIHIPAGPFLMGSDMEEDTHAYDDELPQHEVTLPDYWIAKYPVTVAQWRVFVQVTNYDEFDRRILSDANNHPVRWVTWHNVLAYVHWLDGILKKMVSIQAVVKGGAESERMFWQAVASGRYQITLPSEAEWEKAARGPLFSYPIPSQKGRWPGKRASGYIYPWGKEITPHHANYDETDLSTTSSVGAFPKGGSPYGVLDMGGNVWEWTRSLYQKYPYDPADGRENLQAPNDVFRVLRGGSFGSNHENVRCTVRLRPNPNYWNRSNGFRLALSPTYSEP